MNKARYKLIGNYSNLLKKLYLFLAIIVYMRLVIVKIFFPVLNDLLLSIFL